MPPPHNQYGAIAGTGYLRNAIGFGLFTLSPRQIAMQVRYGNQNSSLKIPYPFDNEWHHVAFVRDGEEMVLYLDGEEAARKTGGVDFRKSNMPFRIGSACGNFFFKGQISDVRLWDVPRSATEIEKEMGYRLRGNEPGLIGYWPLDEGEGTAARDRSAGYHDGLLDKVDWVQVDDLPLQGDDTIVIKTAPDAIGVPTPSRGLHETTAGAAATYSTTIAAFDTERHYRCIGYALETRAEDNSIQVVTNLGVATLAYPATARSARLTWLYEPDGYRLDAAPLFPETGSVTVTPGPDLSGDCYSPGTEVIIRAEPAEGLSLSHWVGIEGKEAEQPLVIDGPAHVRAVFAKPTAAKKVLHFASYQEKGLKTERVLVNTTNAYTLSTWVYLEPRKMKAGTEAPIMEQGGNSPSIFSLDYRQGTNDLRFLRRNGWTITEDRYTRVMNPPTNTWLHIAAVWDLEKRERRLYLNGMLAQADADASVTKPAMNFTIGFHNWGQCFYGHFAEMSVWNVAFDEARVNAAMASRPDFQTLNGGECLAYWPFDEGEGTTCRDLSPGNTTLTIEAPESIVWEEVADFPPFNGTDERLSFPVDVTHPEDVTVTELTTPEANGGTFYYKDSTATFSAESDRYPFVRWYGDLPENQVSNKTVSIVVEKASYLSPYFVRDWHYDATAKTITDGYWVLKVTERGGELTITGVVPETVPLVRILDLAKPVDGGAYTIVSIGNAAFAYQKTTEELYLPETVRRIEGTWWDQGAFVDCTALHTVEPFLPPSLNHLGCYVFAGCTEIRQDLILAPAEEGFTFFLGAYHRHQFAGSGITSADFGEAVTNLPWSLFEGCPNLTNVVLRGDIGVMEADVFKQCAKLENVWFSNFPQNQLSTNRPNAFTGLTKRKIRIFAPRDDLDWAAFMGSSSNMTPWNALDQATQDAYWQRFPDTRKPKGLATAKSFVGEQWISSWDPRGTFTLLLLR